MIEKYASCVCFPDISLVFLPFQDVSVAFLVVDILLMQQNNHMRQTYIKMSKSIICIQNRFKD